MERILSFVKEHSSALIVSFLLTIVLYFLFFDLSSVPSADIFIHLKQAQEIKNGETAYPSNFLMYLIVNIMSYAINPQSAMSLLLAFSVSFKFLITYLFLKSSNSFSKSVNIITSLTLLFVFSIGTVGLEKYYFYKGSFVSNVWHNSTTIFLMPIAILLFYYLFYKKNDSKNIVLISILILINASIKPSFLFIVSPLLFFVFIYSWSQKRPKTQYLYFSLGIAAIIVLQFVLIFLLNIGSLHKSESSIGISFLDFFKTVARVRYFPLALILGYLFPVVYTVTNKKNITKEVILSWALVFLSICLFVFVNETGPRRTHGNFYWQIVPTTYMLFLVIIRDIFNKYTITKKKLLLVFAYMPHFIYGAYYFYRVFYLKSIF